MKQPFTNRRGFTLIEIMIVVVIIGIVTATIVMHLRHADLEAKRTAAMIQLKQVRQQLVLYRMQYSEHPPVQADTSDWGFFLKRGTDPMNPSKYYGPYLADAPANQLRPPAIESVIAVSPTNPPEGTFNAGFVFTLDGQFWLTRSDGEIMRD